MVGCSLFIVRFNALPEVGPQDAFKSKAVFFSALAASIPQLKEKKSLYTSPFSSFKVLGTQHCLVTAKQTNALAVFLHFCALRNDVYSAPDERKQELLQPRFGGVAAKTAHKRMARTHVRQSSWF